MSELSNMITNLHEMAIEKKQLEQAIRTKKDELAWHVLKNEPGIAEYLITHASVDSIKTAWSRVGGHNV